MKIKQKIKSLKYLIIFLVIFTSVFISSHNVPNASADPAWCVHDTGINENLNDFFDTGTLDLDKSSCVQTLWNSMTPDAKAQMGNDYSKFVDQARGCVGTGSVLGSPGNGQVECVNATAYCLENSINASTTCNSNYIGAIADDQSCNDGKSTSSKLCDPVREANEQITNPINDKYKQNVLDTCTKAQGAQQASIQRCTADYEAAKDVCQKQQQGWTAGEGYMKDTTTYDTCLQKEVLKRASDQSECKGRGDGIWMDNETKDPNGPNTLPIGCYYEATDLTNPEACKAAGKGFEWKVTGNKHTSNPNDDSYGCVDPANPDGRDNKGDPDVPQGNTNPEQFGNCGEAQTVLVKCTGTGVGALNDVLKIIINVLTILVGIAAVGGLAWASVQYAKAEDDSGSVKESRTLIRNIVIGLILYGFLIALVNWLVPGGVIGS